MKKEIYFLFVVICLLLIINYSWVDGYLTKTFTEGDYVHVDRVIDGDTVVSGNQSIRLLGINTLEKGEKYSSEAGEFLEGLVLDKDVRLEYGKEVEDRYGRTLAYLYYNDVDINLEIVRNGYGNYYFPSGKDWRFLDFENAWNECLNVGENLCERSLDVCALCLEVVELDYVDEEVVFRNKCNYDCDLSGWSVKDEGRKKYFFEDFVIEGSSSFILHSGLGDDSKNELFWGRSDYVWTDSGDSLFLFDGDGNLVLWKSF